MFETSPHPASQAPDSSRATSRRWFLAGGAAVVVGAAAGTLAEFINDEDAAAPVPPPNELLAAIAAEQTLIADLDATTGGTPAARRVIVAARADHAAHLAALRALLTAYRPANNATSASPSRVRGTPRTLAQLRAAEDRASDVATRRAESLAAKGPAATAALLASIAACEASHAELLQ